ncbi:DUF2066 domain-containing protein [uncultured Desulfosarcina sp.]|uniref:DUF2066 domain-containing protein n=1 Tax=uncultured Desulfosarcina sp. TaxID=218289 RepID=UPI0029C84B5F|nr:DUF2066 domain-containing protein [uncultured Desulfosarcina sp.]
MFKHDTMKKWIGAVGLLVVMAFVPAAGHGASRPVVKQVNVLGTAVVHGNELVEARQNAVDDALVAAVGQVVLEMLTGETVVRRFKVINDNLLERPKEYIQNYRVLTESVLKDTIHTLVQVDISVDRVSRDLSRLGLALSGTAYPHILFMMAEKNATDADFACWWGDRRMQQRTISEAAMAEALRASGFVVIDTPDVSTPMGLPVTVSEEQMAALGKRLGADIVVAGSGTAAPAPNTLGASTAYEAVVEAQAFSVQSGKPVARTRQKFVVSGQDAFAGGREALSGAGAAAGDALAHQIMVAWQQEQDRSAAIHVEVEGTGGHIASFVRLRTAIATLSGVKDLKMREMSSDKAVMAVSYQGTARSLADALLLKTFEGFGLDIYEVTAEVVRIRLVHQ